MTVKTNQKTSKKISKGDFGYFKSEKKRRLIITAILFSVPLFIFFTFHNTNNLVVDDFYHVFT